MKEPTLDEFLLEVVGGRGNAYVRFPGFATLYVRFTKRYLLGKMQSPVLDLANMVAKKPGKGAFTALFEHIRTAYPEVWIYVECVQTRRVTTAVLARASTWSRRQDPMSTEAEQKKVKSLYADFKVFKSAFNKLPRKLRNEVGALIEMGNTGEKPPGKVLEDAILEWMEGGRA
jgi:hypothetical protein